MVTIYDIAKETGYSVTTVSKALNNYTDISEKTKQRILKTSERMGYLPNANARALTTKRSWTIGVLFAEALNIGIRHPFFSAIIESFKAEAEINGYDLLFISKDIGGKKVSYLDHCQFRGIDGVIIVCTDYEDKEVKELLHSRIPCVIIDLEHHDHAITICSDNIQGSMQAVEYLYSLGHRKIAHLGGQPKTFPGARRRIGYEMALEKLQLPKKEEYIVYGGYFSIDGGYEAMKLLLDLADRPTAVYVAGDMMAIGAMKAIQERGLKIPEDMSIIGFDDIDAAQYVTPELTTIRQDTKEMGEKAAQLLIGYIAKEKEEMSAKLPVELVVRSSCGRP